MEAPVLAGKKSSINLDRCIGCGLCVPTCPSKAIKLVRKEKDVVPPKNFGELYRKILTKKVGTMKAFAIGVKKITGQKV
jgi:ferredoxin